MNTTPVPSLPPELFSKLQRLLRWLKDQQQVVVAFSGGVDSTVLARAAFEALANQALAVTAVSPSLAETERNAARELAAQIGIQHQFLETSEFSRPEYVENAPDRCFFCKDTLYSSLECLLDLEAGTVVNGANLDDRGDHRPGMRAAREHGVRSPLIEVGFTKLEVRQLARFWDLPVWDKPASPCLSSRIRYGIEVTPERTRMVEQAEQWLRTTCGLRELRVRLEAHETARIEVPLEALPKLVEPSVRTAITEQLRAIGFHYVTLDLEGFRSGSLNAMIPVEQLETWSRAEH